MKDEENQETPPVEEIEEIEEVTPVVKDDEVADILTQANLQATLSQIIDEKLALNETATDDEEMIDAEDEEEEKKGIGMFPILLIGTIGIIVVASVLMPKRPNISRGEVAGDIHG